MGRTVPRAQYWRAPAALREARASSINHSRVETRNVPWMSLGNVVYFWASVAVTDFIKDIS